ncbi:hypothetical protein A1O1_02150 [Capronia coronata CBS 617.96]|uniref:Cupin type-2 domain-containing protein n=1 Tax=Capronia coronata CBS 617.96 TaxID=1182541 RepID=W9YLI1_9EURO|nr:uncharacterized protein A1O1_02150 [Capronia coronata CBS 617.96]EXJ93757.1 hypothetical protein A1O1_02150 [Capronia coronata CBS 617.96]
MAPIAEVAPMGTQLSSLEKTVSPKEALEQTIRAADMVPLWNTGAPPTSPAPHTKHIPAVWRYADSKSLLLKAAEVVDPREAERRAVLFINPGPKSSPHTSDVLLAAHQLILPGEQALCHRHTPFAVRFLIEGEQGYTAISGKKMYMGPGDLIITPTWNWHDHGNEGTKNVIWLDGLNIPFYKHLPVDFTEHYEEEFGSFTHESKPVPDSLCQEMKFPWSAMQAKLDGPGGTYAFAEYLLPDGKPVNTIIGAFAERIAAGAHGPARQETPSNVFQVHRGRGWTEVTGPKGESTRLDWGPKDCFVIPAWYRFQHFADAEETVYLFSFSDKSMHVNLGFYRSKE